MAFKTVSSNIIDIKKEKGKSYVGNYNGKEVKPSKNPGKTYNIWHFIGEDGLPFSIFGFGWLDSAMKNIKEGSRCRLTYTGTKFMPTTYKPSGQDVHQVHVEVDDEGEAEKPPIEEYEPE